MTNILAPRIVDAGTNTFDITLLPGQGWTEQEGPQIIGNTLPDINIGVLTLRGFSQAQLDTLAADSRYFVLDDLGEDDVITNAELTALGQYILAQGVTVQQIQDVIGDVPNGRARKEIVETLRTWLKEL